jgi:hypothetical protein
MVLYVGCVFAILAQKQEMKMKNAQNRVGNNRMSKDRFLKMIKYVTDNGCWIWSGALNHKGYGNTSMWIGKTRGSYLLRGSHRISYFLHNGPFDYSLCVCHKCDNPICVNPDHLFLGSIVDNTKDMVAKCRTSKGENRPTAKLTETQVLEIRSKYATGKYSQRDLGKEYGIDWGNIHCITARKTWKHI